MLQNDSGLMDGRCEVSGRANLERSAKKIKKTLKSLKATAAAHPKDHRPIERHGVMSWIEIQPVVWAGVVVVVGGICYVYDNILTQHHRSVTAWFVLQSPPLNSCSAGIYSSCIFKTRISRAGG